jgi:multicomponent Na+:H+ antiporter subunit D
MAADGLAPGIPWPDLPWVVLPVAVPLVAGMLAVPMGARAGRLAWPAGLLGIAAATGLAAQVWRGGVAELAIGGWAPPLGIALRADGLGAAFVLAGALVAGAVLPFAGGSVAGGRQGGPFWPLAFFLIAGVNASFLGGDLFNLYVALELLTVTAVALVAIEGGAKALGAAMRYLLFALLGSLAYLLGAAILYAGHATLDIGLLAGRVEPEGPALVAVALMTAGLMAKMALFPLHAWLPAAHAAAPAPASALLSALVVKAPFVILLRLWFEVLPGAATPAVAQGMGLLGAGGVLLGSLLALRQERLKLVVAYSTVAQLGYLALVFPLAGGANGAQPWVAGAWSGAVLHALAHALAKGGMFLAVGAFREARGSDRLDRLSGVSHDVPIAAFAFGLAAVSLMGLPVSGGFLAKYLMLTSAFASGQWWWGIVLVGGGLLAAAYLFRPLGRMLARREGPPAARVARGRQGLALLLALMAVALGLLSAWPWELLQIGRPEAAAEGLS